jgi:hypothetical protein
MFNCCQVADFRVLKHLPRAGKKLMENIRFVTNAETGALEKRIGKKHLFTKQWMPSTSVGSFMADFKLTTTPSRAQTLRTQLGDEVQTIEEIFYTGKPPMRRYIITHVDHIMTSEGYFTKTRFQIMPQFYYSKFIANEAIAALEPQQQERVENQQIHERRTHKLYLGTVMIPHMRRGERGGTTRWNDYLAQMSGNTQDSGLYNVDVDAYFDRVSVRIEGEKLDVLAKVARQKGLFTPFKVGDTVLLTRAATPIQEQRRDEQAGWVVIGHIPTSAYINERQTAEGGLYYGDGRFGFDTPDVYLNKNYNTTFDSSFVDLITDSSITNNNALPRNNMRQNAIILSNNDYLNENREGGITGTGNKTQASTKVAIESKSKRGSRRQAATLNLNSLQPKDGADATIGNATTELAVYEIADNGVPSTTRPYGYLKMKRLEDGRALAELKITGEADGQSVNTSNQSVLTLDGEGNLGITTTTNASIYGQELTLIGTNEDSGAEILALDGDKIEMSQSLSLVLDAISAAMDALGGYVGGAGVPLLPQASAAKAAIDLAITSMAKTTGKGDHIGTIDVNNASRKIKGKS